MLLNNTFRIDSKVQEDSTSNALSTWTRGHSRRGLEIWINPDHGTERIKKRVRFIRTLLKAHELMKKEGRDAQRIADDLARLSKKGTVHATKFAACMGYADANSVEMQQQEARQQEASQQETSLYLAMPTPKQIQTDCENHPQLSASLSSPTS